MTVGIQIFNPPGTLVWDSSTAVGGIVADYQSVVAGGSGTWTYPAFAGRAVDVCDAACNFAYVTDDFGVMTDASLGYPRVTAVSRPFARQFYVVIT